MSQFQHKKILILGASGTIGSALVWYFLQQNQRVIIKTRSKTKLLNSSSKHTFYANLSFYNNGLEIIEDLASVDLAEVKIIINLVGEPIFSGIWTKHKKAELYNSRIDSTAEIVAKINRENFYGVFFNASASGIYGDRADEILSEQALCANNSFIEKLCLDWEQQALKVKPEKQSQVSTIILRTSIVLSQNGGFVPQMLMLYKYNLGAVLGDGKQYLSWISINDYVRAIDFLAERALAGKIQKPLIVNMSSPTANSAKQIHEAFKLLNNQFKICKIKVFNLNYARIPKFLIKLIFAEKSSLLLSSVRLLPSNLLDFGFKFNDLDFNATLQRIYFDKDNNKSN